MNPLFIIILFCCGLIGLFVLAVYLITFFFRYACVLCGLPKPSVMTALGVLLLIWICKTNAEAVMKIAVSEAAQKAGLPPWEGWLIALFLFLPLDLLISAALHAGLMRIRFGKGIEVWFVQTLMILSVVAAIAGVAAVAILAAR